MTLIKSISGIRGTIGGRAGENLTPLDIIEMVAAFGEFLKSGHKQSIVVGRDGRISGNHIIELVKRTLVLQGYVVIDLDYSTTPTVAMEIENAEASGGIMVSASHNPAEWNALKFFNHHGEFIDADDGKTVLEIANNRQFSFAKLDEIGRIEENHRAIEHHIDEILALSLIDSRAIENRKFRVAVDCINSTGSISVVPLLQRLGCTVHAINNDLTGQFAHSPEPLPDNLSQIQTFIQQNEVDLGVVVDPDVDRLCFIDEKGYFFGEEYTIVAIADYILRYTSGPVVSNLSSTQALSEIAEQHNVQYFSSAVGEVNVVKKMKEVHAVFGGEGNGGVIYPALHYGRDALVGIGLFLSFLSSTTKTVSEIRELYPRYGMAKLKAELKEGANPDNVINSLANEVDGGLDLTDGLKIIFDKEWVHLRKSNTEPIIRIYAESSSIDRAMELAKSYKKKIEQQL